MLPKQVQAGLPPPVQTCRGWLRPSLQLTRPAVHHSSHIRGQLLSSLHSHLLRPAIQKGYESAAQGSGHPQALKESCAASWDSGGMAIMALELL